MDYAKVSGQNVVIKLPIDLLVTAFNHYPEKYHDDIKVKFKRQFATGFAELINGLSENSESGLTFFQECIDQVFEEMIESAAPYIKVPDEDDY
ncbi:hypothetical protein [Bacillus sp. JJ722]|uniref:hypothetical protein n=1 Tax=Bacillus sp. JJ722 TaxID=3122973 RepID=UPI0030006B55